jgi:hypothetical protein
LQALTQSEKPEILQRVKPTVLILDDQETARQYLHVLLSSAEKGVIEDVNILECSDVATALRTLSTIPVHVLLPKSCQLG